MSKNKNIILGVTGSIAAHKAADLASLLTKQKCSVRVVMTADAQRFITPLPFKVLSRHPVVTGLYDEEEGWKPTHIEMADEAGLFAHCAGNGECHRETGARPGGRCADMHGAGVESKGENFNRTGDERQNVAAPGHAAECENAEGARRGIHRAG